MSYNPPFCYAWDTFVQNGEEHLVMGLGNGMVLRYTKKGLSCEEMHGQVHNGQISSLQVLRDTLLTASSGDKSFAIHQMNLQDINVSQLQLLKVQLLAKPNAIQCIDLGTSVFVCDVTKDISSFKVKY